MREKKSVSGALYGAAAIARPRVQTPLTASVLHIQYVRARRIRKA
jgi:hypothetical protein